MVPSRISLCTPTIVHISCSEINMFFPTTPSVQPVNERSVSANFLLTTICPSIGLLLKSVPSIIGISINEKKFSSTKYRSAILKRSFSLFRLTLFPGNRVSLIGNRVQFAISFIAGIRRSSFNKVLRSDSLTSFTSQ